MNLLSNIKKYLFEKKDDLHWNNPFEKGTESFNLYQKGSDNYFKYLRDEMPSTVYKVEVWIEGIKLRPNGHNRFYTRLAYTDKEEAVLIAIQTAKARNLDIEDYRILLSINGFEQMEIPIY